MLGELGRFDENSARHERIVWPCRCCWMKGRANLQGTLKPASRGPTPSLPATVLLSPGLWHNP
jgi:hypothetical protein